MSRHRLNLVDRLWLWRHRDHEPRVNTSISVPSFDPSARGVLLTCPCGKVRAG